MSDSTAILDSRQEAGPVALATLAKQINDHHRQCESVMNAGLRHALEAGRLLAEAKGQVSHGEWGDWLADNFDGSDRTARVYMQVANRWPELEAKRQASADLGIDGALKLLAEPRPEVAETFPLEGNRFLDAPLEDRRRACTQWWDIFATYVLMLDAAEWPTEKIAETLGMPERDVALVLDPQPPKYRFDNMLNEATQRLYQDAVAESIAWQISHLYSSFHAQHRAPREGFSDVVPVLKILEKRSRRRHERLKGSEWDIINAMEASARTPAEAKTWGIAITCCVTDDMREAMGIATPEEPCSLFAIKFARWCILAEQAVKQMEAATA